MLKDWKYEGFNTFSKRGERVAAKLVIEAIKKGAFDEKQIQIELQQVKVWGHDITGRMYCEYLREMRGEKSEMIERALK